MTTLLTTHSIKASMTRAKRALFLNPEEVGCLKSIDEIDGGGLEGEDSLCDDNVEGDILPEDLQINHPDHERADEAQVS